MGAGLETAAVIGGGSWGSAFARYLGGRGVATSLWCREQELVDALRATGENARFLPGFRFPPTVTFSNDLGATAASAEAVFVAVPSRFCRAVYTQLAAAGCRPQVIVSLTKGFDPQTGMRMSELAAAVLPRKRTTAFAVLSGPSFAREVANGRPTAVVVASRSAPVARRLQQWLGSETLRIYTSSDVTGVEIAGATKNVIAIGAGIVDALELGPNARAALIARGLAEIARLGCRAGGRSRTFAGLAGIGDLVLTCTDAQSRNYQVGWELGHGRDLASILAATPAIPEGPQTVVAVLGLARRLAVDMPITTQIEAVLQGTRTPAAAVAELMERPPSPE